MESPQTHGEALTAFDSATADAVVEVLSRAGIPAWQDPDPDEHGDVVVRVNPGMRERAMQEMGRRMEEIQATLRRSPAPDDSTRPHEPDVDDPADGPPLTMERFADLRVLVAVVLGPLLVITVAGPFLTRTVRVSVIIFIVIATGLALFIARRRG